MVGLLCFFCVFVSVIFCFCADFGFYILVHKGSVSGEGEGELCVFGGLF